MKIAFYGSSILSSYWNGAATYYRGLLGAMARRGAQTTFLEPIAFGRQERADGPPPTGVSVAPFEATAEGLARTAAIARAADVAIVASGMGACDAEALQLILSLPRRRKVRAFWDVDAPATLAALRAGARPDLAAALPALDLVFAFGGGEPVREAYRALGAPACVIVNNGFDPATHYPVSPDPAFACDLAFLANRMPDRDARVEAFFFDAARRDPTARFLLAGAGWESVAMPPNVTWIGHLSTTRHNAFNCSAGAVLNLAREDMATVGHAPATRVFEALGAGACLISDPWPGLDEYVNLGVEALSAQSGAHLAVILETLTPDRARRIGEAGRARALATHTYDRRANDALDALEAALEARTTGPRR